MLSRRKLLLSCTGVALAGVLGSSPAGAATAAEKLAPKESALRGKAEATEHRVLTEDDLNNYRKEIEKNSAALAEYEQLLDEARAALAEYKKAVGIQQQPGADAAKETRKKILEILANGGLAVTAIFFGFFGFLLGALPGVPKDTNPKVRETYWWAALWTGIGVLTSLSTSVFGILALGDIWENAAGLSIFLGCATGLLLFLVTGYFLVTLRGR